MEVLIDEKVPVLRFPEFTGSWEFKKGKELFLNRRQKGNNNLPIFSVTMDRGMIPRDSLENRIQNDAKSEDNLVAYPKDIVYNMMRMWQGSLGIAYQACMVSPAYIILQPKENVHSEFYNYLLKTKKYLHLLESYSYGLTSDRLRLYYKDFSSIKLPKPSILEQKKISVFLTAIDNKIEQLTQNKNLLEQYKKGVMQQIFSQQIRVKDENGNDYPDWEEMKAKEVFKNHSNKNHNGDLPILAITQDKGTVLRDSIDIRIQSSEQSIKSYKIVEVGDFIISLRSFQGGIEYSDVMGICSPAYTILKPKISICEIFFKHYFKKESFIEELNSTVIGIREGKQISFDAFSGLILPFPCLEEQKKIASFLNSIYIKIEAVENQLSVTQAYKKGLLQQLFV